MGEIYFVFVHTPVPQRGIGFGEEDHVEGYPILSCQSIEHGDAIRRNDLAEDDGPPVHAAILDTPAARSQIIIRLVRPVG